IGGTGVAAGYLNQPNLTRESFIQNPYNKQKDIIYKTGDIVKRLPNGELQFIGRKDKQVKIRGFRIELDGIKHEALKIDNVDDIVITTDEDHQTKKLYLFYKGKANEQYIRHYLRQVLPDYMIPHFIVKVDTFPLTVNGKINIKMLIEKEKISINNSEVNENASQLHETDIIINIWRKILSVEDISTDNDFYELGGDSLLASRMLHLVKQQLGIKIPIKEFLKNPTINSLISSEPYKKLKETREVNYNYKNLKPLINENILLTGSNGFLGIHLLNELSKEQNCIYCLVRAKSRTEAKLKLSDSIKKYKLNVNLESDKIKVIVGDIASENLGLPEEEYNLLSATISKIYNCAANVNFMETISNALKTNFYGVINLVAFSENVYKKELHHISTLASLQDADRNKLLTEDYFSTDDRLFDIGYDYSKFKAENYLSKVLKYRNDIFIYRLGRLSGSTFACKNPKSDLLWLLIKTIVETKMIPKDFSGNFEIAPVDKVAENIIYLSSTKKQNVFHLYNNNENTYEELFSILPKRNYRVLDYRDWIENLKNIQIDHPLKPLMPLFDEDIIKQTFTRYSNDKTNEILKDKCYEKVSIQILKNYMEEFTND
ncbi:non-ribosomal peptide synthetase, partial [Staphylococcus caprae]|uniref:non-ribosomal peptide synthetase n=1 Tax=Staphylococcus caprae TaxID=29380 RepID=UPI003B21CB61